MIGQAEKNKSSLDVDLADADAAASRCAKKGGSPPGDDAKQERISHVSVGSMAREVVRGGSQERDERRHTGSYGAK